MTGLPPDLDAELVKDLVSARDAQSRGDLVAAEKYSLAAWERIPEPKLAYARGQILAQSMVEFYRGAKRFDEARVWLARVEGCYGEKNPVSMLLRGTISFEEGNTEEATRVLGELYAADGARPFEAIDPKYLKFIRSHLPGRRRR